MAGLLDIMDALNLIDRVEGVVSSFIHADWQGSAQSAGVAGVAIELARAVTATNSWSFQIPRESDWSGASVERFLRHYGIIIWGRRVTSKYFHFSVKERQANWAEYLLLRRGIPISGRLYNPRNAIYGEQHAPGDRPPAWADQQRKSHGPLGRFLDMF